MVAQDLNAQWIQTYRQVLDGYDVEYNVLAFNDIQITLDTGAQVLIRNTASVVPQRIHLFVWNPAHHEDPESVVAPEALEKASVATKLTDEITRVRGRAAEDVHGRIYAELICMAGEPGHVPTAEVLQTSLPQLFTLAQQQLAALSGDAAH